MRIAKHTLIDAHLHYQNHYTNIEQFAKDYELTVPQAIAMTKLAKSLHDDFVESEDKRISGIMTIPPHLL